MVRQMTMIYFLIAALPILAELSPEICTSGFVRKVCLALLSVGGIVAMNGRGTDLICIGIAILFVEKYIHFNFNVNFLKSNRYNKND